MDVNWFSVAAAAAGGTLGFGVPAGVFVALIKGWFKRPEQRADITERLNKTAERLLERADARNEQLESTLKLTREDLDKTRVELAQTRIDLSHTRDALWLLTEAVERAIPLLDAVSDNDSAIAALRRTVGRTKANFNGT